MKRLDKSTGKEDDGCLGLERHELERRKRTEDGLYKCQRITKLPLISKYSKQREQTWATQTTYTHSDHSIFRGTISQALITVGCSVSYLVCQNFKFAHVGTPFTDSDTYIHTQLCVYTPSY